MKVLLIMFALFAGPVMAQPDPYLGARCSLNETIYVEADGSGFNDHTVCEWVTIPTVKSYSLHGTIACQTIYVLDASADPIETQTFDEGTRHLRLVLIDDIDMDVYLDRVPLGRFGACG
jgi:hypothetical protein